MKAEKGGKTQEYRIVDEVSHYLRDKVSYVAGT